MEWIVLKRSNGTDLLKESVRVERKVEMPVTPRSLAAIAAGMTSAITNPLMPEVKASVMAADVLMGHDPDCGRWITVNRVPVPEGEVSRRRVNRRAVAVG